MNGARTWRIVETTITANVLVARPFGRSSQGHIGVFLPLVKRMYAARTVREMEQSRSYHRAYIKPVRELYMLRRRYSGRLSVTGRISGQPAYPEPERSPEKGQSEREGSERTATKKGDHECTELQDMRDHHRPRIHLASYSAAITWPT